MRRVPIVDLALTLAALLLTALYSTVVVERGFTWYDSTFTVIHLGLTVALLTRSTHRRASFVASYALLAAMALLVHVAPLNLGLSPIVFCAPLALYKVARHDPPAWGVTGLFLGIAGSFVSPMNRFPGGVNGALVAWMILVMVGTYLWASGRRRTELAHEADLARARLEHDRETALRVTQAQIEERARIAREVHDVVAHSLAVVNVQANTALAIGTEEQMRDSLLGVRDASKSALDEVRSLVGVLRDDSGAREVTGDLTRLPGLLAEASGAGLDVRADLPDETTLLTWQERWPAAVRLAVVRVTQEALSNVLKHGGPSPRARVRVAEENGECVVEVTNDARRQGDSSGFGLVGLRERVTLAGGHLAAGPDGEGFAVLARIPTKEHP